MNDMKKNSTSVSVTFKVEPQLKYIIVELTTEASLIRILPLTVHNLEGYIFIRWTSMETKNCKISIVLARSLKQTEI
jgi:hypothetical protein